MLDLALVQALALGHKACRLLFKVGQRQMQCRVRRRFFQVIHGIRQPATALFRPAAVSVYADAPLGSPRNRVPVTVTDLEPLGDRVRVRGRARGGAGDVPLTAEITPAAVADLGLVPGREVTFSVKATEVSVYGTFKPGTAPSGPATVTP